MYKRFAAALAAAALLASGCAGAQGSEPGTVALDFFQFKPEAVATFDRLIADFEQQHPRIDVRQHHVPAAETAIRTRLVKDDVPDVLTLNGNGTFGEIASAGVFHDFSDHPASDRVAPGVQQVLNDLGTAAPGEINGLPFASNANGVLYNEELFAQHGVAIPRTWRQLMNAVETFEQAGVTPFYGTLADAWTALPAFNQFAANIPPDDFWEERRSGGTSFERAYPQVAAKLAEIYEHTQKSAFARNYDAGNKAFADGEAAMLIQGSYALPAIRAHKPAFEIGAFPLPTGSDPGQNRLVSGVDVALTMGRDSEHPEEALEFIDFLMSPEAVTAYAEEQSAVPTLKGTDPGDPALASLVPYFEQNRVTGYPDHQIPLAAGLEPLVQQFLLDDRSKAFLRSLDENYDRVLERTS
jgi:raffinose/stachyose/melibiose transport system substrate-binding protein